MAVYIQFCCNINQINVTINLAWYLTNNMKILWCGSHITPSINHSLHDGNVSLTYFHDATMYRTRCREEKNSLYKEGHQSSFPFTNYSNSLCLSWHFGPSWFAISIYNLVSVLIKNYNTKTQPNCMIACDVQDKISTTWWSKWNKWFTRNFLDPF